MNSSMEALFIGMDNWYEEAKNATKASHKAALINAYGRVIKVFTEGLAKKGIRDLEIKESDSEGTKYLKTVIKYDTAKTYILQATNDFERFFAITLASAFRQAAKDHVRAMSHDEL